MPSLALSVTQHGYVSHEEAQRQARAVIRLQAPDRSSSIV